MLKIVVDGVRNFMYNGIEKRWNLVQKKLIAWRKYHSITQKEMANKLGVDVRTYINKEQGVTQFKANEMFLIANILNKDINEIFLPTSFVERQRAAGKD